MSRMFQWVRIPYHLYEFTPGNIRQRGPEHGRLYVMDGWRREIERSFGLRVHAGYASLRGKPFASLAWQMDQAERPEHANSNRREASSADILGRGWTKHDTSTQPSAPVPTCHRDTAGARRPRDARPKFTLTRTAERCKVVCRCGCFILSFFDHDFPGQAVVRCPLCGAQERLAMLRRAQVARMTDEGREAAPGGRGAPSVRQRPAKRLQPSFRRAVSSLVMSPVAWLKRFASSHRTQMRGRSPTRRSALVLLGVLVALLAVPDLATAKAQDPGTFLANLHRRAIEQLAQPNISEEERKRRSQVLFREAFNIPVVGRFVLGRYWRNISEQERVAFLQSFENVVVERYSPLFSEHSDIKLSIGHGKAERISSGSYVVSSTILRSASEPVRVDWRLLSSNGRYQIIDVILEGVSIAVTLRSEYGAFMHRNDGDIALLISRLRQEAASARAAMQQAGTGPVR